MCAPFLKMADDKRVADEEKEPWVNDDKRQVEYARNTKAEELEPWVRKTLRYFWCFRDIFTGKCDRGKACTWAHAPNKSTRTNVARALAEKKRQKHGVCLYKNKCHQKKKCPYAHAYDKAQAAAWDQRRSIGPVIAGMKNKWCWANLGGRECPQEGRECVRWHPKRPIEWKRMFDQYHNVLCVTKYGEFLLDPQSSDDSDFEDFSDEYSE